MIVGNLASNGGQIGVLSRGLAYDDPDLGRTRLNRFDVKNVRFNYVESDGKLYDTITNAKTLKWNDSTVFREYLDGPMCLTPRFGVEGDFLLTNRIKETKVAAGKMNKAGEIVELSGLNLDAIKEMRKDFPFVERFLRKISKFVLR